VQGFSADSFVWMSYSDHENSVIAFVRRGRPPGDDLLVVANLTPRTHLRYRLGVTAAGKWQLAFNSDETRYFGSGFPALASAPTESSPWQGQSQSLLLDLPPLAVLTYRLHA
jgi:1,4-alpha-glucan branching enzyme